MVEEAEKEGGIRGSTSAPNFLKELLFDFGAVDLGHSGNKFTWWNKRWVKVLSRKDWIVLSLVSTGE